eukprot:778123-Amphidinium_carterae.1
MAHPGLLRASAAAVHRNWPSVLHTHTHYRHTHTIDTHTHYRPNSLRKHPFTNVPHINLQFKTIFITKSKVKRVKFIEIEVCCSCLETLLKSAATFWDQ